MKYIYCNNCGYNEEVKAILFDKCPKCNSFLIIDDEEADNEMPDIIEELLKTPIKILGG